MSSVQKKAALAALAYAVPAALLISSLQGCVSLPSISGVPLPQKTVNQLQAGKTTTAEVLKWFGPPLSIVTRGGTVTIANGTHSRLGSMDAYTSYETVQADTFFELFSTKHTITDQDRIYYYQYAVSYKYMVFLLVYFNETASMRSDRLWVLIDEQTGLVEDYVFRKKVWWVGATERSSSTGARASSEGNAYIAQSSMSEWRTSTWPTMTAKASHQPGRNTAGTRGGRCWANA